MSRIKKLSILLFVFSIMSCSNSNDDSSNNEEKASVKDIYVCGYEKKSSTGRFIATVWKNGIATSLTNGTNNAVVNDVAVAGNDVYAVGFEEDANGVQTARLWKNGLQASLPSTPGSLASKVVVNGENVYVLGRAIENNSYVQKMWKNGIISTLPDDRRSIAVNNNNVYTVGLQDEQARFWTNNTGANLTNGDSYSAAHDIAVKGNDVYIVGVEVINKISVAKLWKNGVASDLSDGKFTSVATNISVVGNDVYILGYENNLGTNSKVWKNGEVIWSKEKFSSNDLEAVGQDFYLLDNTDHKAKILKNGVPEDLSSAINSYANSLFITAN